MNFVKYDIFISSRSNPTVVTLSKLKDKKFRDRELIFLADGVKLTEEALLYSDVASVIVRENVADSEKICALADLASIKGAQTIVLSESAFEKITPENSPQGIVAAVKYDRGRHRALSPELAPELGATVMLSEIRDPGNLGTVIRSAAAFGFDSIVAADCADIYNPKTVRASMGAIFKMKIFTSQGSVEAASVLAKSRRLVAAALTEASISLDAFDTRPDDVFLIGNEGHGLSHDVIRLCDSVVKIPIAENTESLNAAIAATILMWEQRRIR